MTPPSSKYGPLHALVAGAVLVYTVLANGFAAFWHQFLHGMDLKLTEENILPLLCTNTLLFGGLFLILWVSTLFQGRDKRDPPPGGSGVSPNGPPESPAGRAVAPRPPPVGSRVPRDLIRLTLLSVIPICLIALGLNWASSELFSRLTNIDLADQALVKFITSNALSLRSKAILFVFILIEAPILEELLFRGVLFGGLSKIMPLWPAILLSGLVFAVIHINAATLIPLWFLGAAFAWLYVRTGTLLAPMAVHFTFNAINLALCSFV